MVLGAHVSPVKTTQHELISYHNMVTTGASLSQNVRYIIQGRIFCSSTLNSPTFSRSCYYQQKRYLGRRLFSRRLLSHSGVGNGEEPTNNRLCCPSWPWLKRSSTSPPVVPPPAAAACDCGTDLHHDIHLLG